MQSPALTRYFAAPSIESVYQQRYQEALLKAAGSKYVALQGFSDLMALEIDIVFDEVNKAALCNGINTVFVPQGIANLYRLITEQVQNPVLFSWLFCSFQTGFTKPKFNQGQQLVNGYETNVPLVRQVIRQIRTFSGAPSAFGDVWRTLIMGNTEIALLKTYRIGYQEDYISHEFFIAYHLNKLRWEIPNFVYTYGMFRCQNPNKSVSGLPGACPLPPMNGWGEPLVDERDYLIMEYVKPGIPLSNLISRLNFDQVMSIYLQVIASCGVAYGRFKFTHYDLYLNNVIVQDTVNHEEVFISYTFEYRTVYIKTQLIAKIIDYGTGYIEVPDKHLGIPTGQVLKFGNLQLSGINGRQALAPNPFHDIYYFSGDLLKTLRGDVILDPDTSVASLKVNLDLFRSIHHIITRFPAFENVKNYPDSDAFMKVFNKQASARFSNSGIVDVSLLSIRAFGDQIDHVLQHYPRLRRNVIFVVGEDPLPINAKILTCDHANCVNWNQIQELVGRQ